MSVYAFRRVLRFACVALVVMLALPSAGAVPPGRVIPVGAPYAIMTPPVAQFVYIGDLVYPVAPGLQVRDASNRIVMPSTVSMAVPIRYQLDQQGAVWRIWILSAAEVAAIVPNE